MLPLAASVINLLLHKQRRLGAGVNVVALVATLAASVWCLTTVYHGPYVPAGVVVSQMGNWPAPFGISVVADAFAAVLLSFTAVVTLVVYVYSLTQSPARFTGGYYHALFPALACGVNWAFLAGDFFNLFVSFEVMLLASYSLLVAGTTPLQMRQAYKYVVLNLIVSLIFVAACGWVYGTTGTLNMAELAALARIPGAIETPAAVAALALAFVFATKAAAFPLWYWLPDTYPTLPPAMGALFGGLLTKVGVYAMVRTLVTIFGPNAFVTEAAAPILLVSAGATMLLAVVGVIGSDGVRRILSIHVISQVGYMILGVGLAMLALQVGNTAVAAVAVAATLLFIVHNMVVKSCLYLCGGMMEQYGGTDSLARTGGLLRRDTMLGVLFLVAAMSLVGLPPLSGFFGKYLLIRESFAGVGGPWGIALGAVAVLTGAFTLLSMAKIWVYGFWSPPAEGSLSATRSLDFRPPHRVGGLLPIAGLVVLALSMGLLAHFYYDVAIAAGRSVVDAEAYVTAVLGPDAAARAFPVETLADTGGRR